jgi:hypothetical protein
MAVVAGGGEGLRKKMNNNQENMENMPYEV